MILRWTGESSQIRTNKKRQLNNGWLRTPQTPSIESFWAGFQTMFTGDEYGVKRFNAFGHLGRIYMVMLRKDVFQRADIDRFKEVTQAVASGRWVYL